MTKSDIDDTIAFWQRRGVRMVDVATELHCTRTWAAVRHRMTAWVFGHWEGER